MAKKFKYDIGISYASEQRDYVKEIESSLQKNGMKCFVDYKEPEVLWGEYLPEKLRSIYMNECRTILIFLSKEYAEKNYTIFESRIACERQLSGNSFLLIKIDDVDLPWLNKTYGYINASQYTIEEITKMVKKKSMI